MRKLTNIGCSVVLALMVCTIIIVIVLSWTDASTATPKTAARTSRNNVILRAAPGVSSVQMFDELRDGPDVKTITFPDGFGCIKLSDPVPHANGAMYFYKLDCNGRIGYVNADWVDD